MTGPPRELTPEEAYDVSHGLTVAERGRLNATIGGLREQLRTTQELLAQWQRNAELAALAKERA